MVNKEDILAKIDDTIQLVDSINSKQAEYIENDEEINLRAKKLCELLYNNGKISDSQKDTVYNKLLNHRDALELFYSNEKIASYSVKADDFGLLESSNPKFNGKTEDEATKIFISELFS